MHGLGLVYNWGNQGSELSRNWPEGHQRASECEAWQGPQVVTAGAPLPRAPFAASSSLKHSSRQETPQVPAGHCGRGHQALPLGQEKRESDFFSRGTFESKWLFSVC